MERIPHQGGEFQDTQIHLVPPPYDEQHQESHDERVIRQGIEQAQRDGTEIDDRTARYIASQLHEGQASALYSLASTGSIAEAVSDELNRDFDQQTGQVQNWINWLGTYCLNREDKGPIPGWAQSAATIDRAEEEARARVDLMERISAAGVTTLGQVATVGTVGDTTEDLPDDQEPDTFSWTDAVRWSPDSGLDDLAPDRLDTLFGEIPDQEIGSAEAIGWFGLLKHVNRPGGAVLSQNSHGFRYGWETSSDEQLTQHWERLQREHDAFTQATRAHNRESIDRDDSSNDQPHLDDRIETTSGHHPEIWVGSLSDYNNGRLHGVWLDATLDPEELHQAVQFMLHNGYSPGTEEWAIMDYDDFCGFSLGEYESLEVVSRIAQGIAEHGEAFAKWVECVGERSEELLTGERFQDYYLGHFDSAEAYAEYILEETGSYEFMDYVQDSLRPYVTVDTVRS